MLFLASSSPRRQALLRHSGLEFSAILPGPEVEGSGPPHELALLRARSKAEGAGWHADLGPGVVIGSDTVVELDGVEYGKAADRSEALRILRRLSGVEHLVHTAIVLISKPTGRRQERVVTSRVALPARSDEELEPWLASEGWRGKAGAYGIQDPECGAVLVEGDHDAVVGLPVAALRAALAWLEPGGGPES